MEKQVKSEELAKITNWEENKGNLSGKCVCLRWTYSFIKVLLFQIDTYCWQNWCHSFTAQSNIQSNIYISNKTQTHYLPSKPITADSSVFSCLVKTHKIILVSVAIKQTYLSLPGERTEYVDLSASPRLKHKKLTFKAQRAVGVHNSNWLKQMSELLLVTFVDEMCTLKYSPSNRLLFLSSCSNYHVSVRHTTTSKCTGTASFCL